MAAVFRSASGYQGNNMALPVPDLGAAIPFYENVMGFSVVSRIDSPHKSAVLRRDGIHIGLVQNGGDPTQEQCQRAEQPIAPPPVQETHHEALRTKLRWCIGSTSCSARCKWPSTR